MAITNTLTMKKLLRSIKTYLLGTSPSFDATNATTNSPSGNQIVMNEPLERTPFRMVGSNDIGYFIGMGNYRLTPIHKTTTEAKNYLISHQWEVTANLIVAITEVYKQSTTNKQTEEQ